MHCCTCSGVCGHVTPPTFCVKHGGQDRGFPFVQRAPIDPVGALERRVAELERQMAVLLQFLEDAKALLERQSR